MEKIDKIICENIEKVISEAIFSKGWQYISDLCQEVYRNLQNKNYKKAQFLLQKIYNKSNDNTLQQYAENAMSYLTQEKPNANGVVNELNAILNYIKQRESNNGTQNGLQRSVGNMLNRSVDRFMNKWLGVNVHHNNNFD